MRDASDIIKCYRCGELKPVDEFAWRRRSRNQRDWFRKPCRSAYHREHYLANKAKYIAQARESKIRLRLERTRWLLDYFVEHPCADCGERDPVVLEFDHLRDKEFDIARRFISTTWDNVMAEVAKCEVVCANCHRRRTASRRPTIRVTLQAELKAGDENRTRTERMETSHAAFTPRPRRNED